MRRSTRVPVCAMALLTAMAGALGACGSESQTEADDVREAIVSLQEAYAARDVDRACELLTYHATVEAATAGHGFETLCALDLPGAWKFMRSAPAAGYAKRPSVSDVVVQGRRATATITAKDGEPVEVGMRRSEGRWKLASFYGTSAPSTTAKLAAVGGRGTPVALTTRAGDPCPDVDPGDLTKLRGGCRTVARGDVRFVVRTIFGTSRFAHCKIRTLLRADGEGRTWMMPLKISNNGVCGDVDFCADRAGKRQAWAGALRRTDAIRHRVNMCFRTCIGRFEGPVELDVARDGRGWRLDAVHDGVGTGAWEVHGDWTIEPSGSEAPNLGRT